VLKPGFLVLKTQNPGFGFGCNCLAKAEISAYDNIA